MSRTGFWLTMTSTFMAYYIREAFRGRLLLLQGLMAVDIKTVTLLPPSSFIGPSGPTRPANRVQRATSAMKPLTHESQTAPSWQTQWIQVTLTWDKTRWLTLSSKLSAACHRDLQVTVLVDCKFPTLGKNKSESVALNPHNIKTSFLHGDTTRKTAAHNGRRKNNGNE